MCGFRGQFQSGEQMLVYPRGTSMRRSAFREGQLAQVRHVGYEWQGIDVHSDPVMAQADVVAPFS
jgi:hypothetical protein